MDEILKSIARWLLQRLYNVKIHGIEHYHRASGPVLIVANHTSYLDAVLLAVFLPDRLTFAINSQVARAWWVRPFLRFVDFFPMDPASALSTKSFIKHMRQNCRAVIFPEGRITVTGSLMKIYQGPGLIADRSGAVLLPVRIDGAQYTPFSRLRGRLRLRWFAPVSLHFLPPRSLALPEELRGRARRTQAGRKLGDIMTEMIFATSNYRRTLFRALLDAVNVHGGGKVVVEDIARRPLNYRQLLTRISVLRRLVTREAGIGENVGILLPSAIDTMALFFALHLARRVPAMLNFTTGAHGLLAALLAAQINVVYTSRRFVAAARLESLVQRMEGRTRVVYLEDLAAQLTLRAKLQGWIGARLLPMTYRRIERVSAPEQPAMVLFTSGSEGLPKGVVLSHANVLANREQLAAKMDFNALDKVLNALPLFHSFGMTAGTLLPLFSGMKVFFYPSPLHYRIIPEIAYDINATILFGTNTFLAGYARYAHPYDFYSIRYVFAGAEKLGDDTRRLWAEKFGLRILEGYGTTETSPVLAMNTSMESRFGSVGRFLPGIEFRLHAVPGVTRGGRLCVKGPNIMLGYLRAEGPGVLEPPATDDGAGWYDTGDIADVDADGYVTLLGRAKRFAKVGGEMVSLALVEHLASRAWPGALHGAIAIPDPQKGEQLVLVTEHAAATRQALLAVAKQEGVPEISVPRKILVMRHLPLLGTGKIDYSQLRTAVLSDSTMTESGESERDSEPPDLDEA